MDRVSEVLYRSIVSFPRISLISFKVDFSLPPRKRAVAVSDDDVRRIFVDGLELALGLQNNRGGNFPASDGCNQLVKLRNLSDVCELV